MRGKEARLCAALLCALVGLSGCGIRARVLPADAEGASDAQTGQGGAVQAGELSGQDLADAGPAEQRGEEVPSGEPDPNAPTAEDPDSERRAYDGHASAELTQDGDSSLLTYGEKPEAGTAADGSPADGARETEAAAMTATEVLTQQEAQRLGVSEEAPQADTVYQYYRTLLESAVGSLFECKRLYVYWETPEDYRTVFKTSPEHGVIVQAGGYDVAAKRREDALTVDDGWIARKAPGCIVKCVDGSVLGSGVHGTQAAQAMLSSLRARPGWEAMDAVRTQTVVLLSGELLNTRWGRLAAALCVARVMYPEALPGLDPEESLRLLSQEATGAAADGIFFFTQKEGD